MSSKTCLECRMPLTTWTFIIGALSLSGFPLLSGFWSKDAVLNSALQGGHWLTFAVGVVTASLTAFYMFRVVFRVFFGAPRSAEAAAAHAPEPILTGPLVLLAVFAVGAGWAGSPWVGDPFARFVFSGTAPHEAFESFGSALLAAAAGLIGILLAYSIYQLELPSAAAVRTRLSTAHEFLARRAYMDDLYQWLVSNGSLGLASFVAIFDRKVINDTGVDLSAFSFIFSGGRLRRVMSGLVYNYAAFIILGVAGLAIALFAVAG